MNEIHIGKPVRARRKAMRLSQAQLARRADSTQGTIDNIEHERCLPSLPVLLGLCKALGCTVEELCGQGSGKSDELEAKNREIGRLRRQLVEIQKNLERESQRIQMHVFSDPLMEE